MQHNPFIYIAGPCVLERADLAIDMARSLQAKAAHFDCRYIFKASYDKANRTSLTSYRGPGLDAGLEYLRPSRRPLACRCLPMYTPWLRSKLLAR